MLPRPPTSTLFPYTTLFRSRASDLARSSTAFTAASIAAVVWALDPPSSMSVAVLRASTYHLPRSEEHTSELQSHSDLVCRLLLEKKKNKTNYDNKMT